MKKLIAFLLTTSIFSATTVGLAIDGVTTDTTVTTDAAIIMATAEPEATETPQEEATEPGEEPVGGGDPSFDQVASELTVTASLEKLPFPIYCDVTLELYSADDNLLDTQTLAINGDAKEYVFSFTVPKVVPGDVFKVRLKDGAESILYYTDYYYQGQDIPFPIYAYKNDKDEEVVSTDISVTLRPYYTKSVNLYYNGVATNIKGSRIVEENAMVPVEALAKYIGLTSYYNDKYMSQTVALGNEYIFFNAGSTYTTVFGKDIDAPVPSFLIDGKVYASLRTFADAIESEITVEDKGTYLDVYLGESKKAVEFFKSIPVNQWGISSRTNYMVWISLGEYKVRVYEGKQYQWKPIYEATCAIGAPWTPSIVGSYEYKYRVPGWYYNGYYVGPCLVFHRGYALHSVLLRYDNTEYDGRVGVGISHGCIRLKKKDIDFIANTIPVNTRIYSTY